MFNFLKDKHRLLNPIGPLPVGTMSERIPKDISEIDFITAELIRWKKSPQRMAMIDGERYYQGDHDINHRKRTVIGEDGKLIEVTNLPNNKIVDNQYAKAVDQKTNYLLGNPFTIETDDATYHDQLQEIFDRDFLRLLKNVGVDALNCGIGWIYIYYDAEGALRFKRFEPYEVMPLWKDAEHTELDCLVRLYEVEVYTGSWSIEEKVELYYPDRIERYDFTSDVLVPDVTDPVSNYICLEDESGKATTYGWGRVPIVPFKYNGKERPLITKVKSLQDSINELLSDFQNQMQEDPRNTILVLKNYDGTDLGEFRRNLATYGAVKTRTVEGAEGGVEVLQVDVNATNYQVILDIFKKKLIENAMTFDSKDERLSGTPNQMNIQSMYSDIDLDADNTEMEFQAGLEQLMWFINMHLSVTEPQDVKFVFDRGILMNEAEMIQNCGASSGIISDKTIISRHPWVTDVEEEIERMEEEKTSEGADPFQEAFVQTVTEEPSSTAVEKKAEIGFHTTSPSGEA